MTEENTSMEVSTTNKKKRSKNIDINDLEDQIDVQENNSVKKEKLQQNQKSFIPSFIN